MKGDTLTLTINIDADYASSLIDRKSTYGYCTFLGGSLVTWKRKKKKKKKKTKKILVCGGIKK